MDLYEQNMDGRPNFPNLNFYDDVTISKLLCNIVA